MKEAVLVSFKLLLIAAEGDKNAELAIETSDITNVNINNIFKDVPERMLINSVINASRRVVSGVLDEINKELY